MKRASDGRSGIMLVEVMVAMAIGMVLLGVATAVFVRVVVMNPAAREHLESTVTLARLAEQFRDDVHAALAATSPEIDGMAKRLRLQMQGDSAIEYELTDDGARRIVIDGAQIRQREQYRMAGLKVTGWEIGTDNREVSLIVGRLSHPGAEGSTELRYSFPILARLARDRRFVPKGELK